MCKQLAGIPQHWHPPPHPTPRLLLPSMKTETASFLQSAAGLVEGNPWVGFPAITPVERPSRGWPGPGKTRKWGGGVGKEDGEDSPPQSRLLSTPRRRGDAGGMECDLCFGLRSGRPGGFPLFRRLRILPPHSRTVVVRNSPDCLHVASTGSGFACAAICLILSPKQETQRMHAGLSAENLIAQPLLLTRFFLFPQTCLQKFALAL